VAVLAWSGELSAIERFVLLTPTNQSALIVSPPLWLAALAMVISTFVVAAATDYAGLRRVALWLAGALIGFAVLSLALSWFFAWDVRFVPFSLALIIATILVQGKRLRQQEDELTEKLFAAAGSIGAGSEKAEHRLDSGLKLLDTVLAPSEAVVFRRDAEGRLVSSARLRTAAGTMAEPTRNAVWRLGIELCEKAINRQEIVVEKSIPDDAATNIALPLRHEDKTVGALLLRISEQFDDEDRPLLLAVGSQMARNLLRENVAKSRRERGR